MSYQTDKVVNVGYREGNDIRQGTPDSARNVSIRPSSFDDNLVSFLSSGVHPPRLKRPDIDLLMYRGSRLCPKSVYEALSMHPVSHVEYRELSRFATHVAFIKIQKSSIISELKRSTEEYKRLKCRFPSRIRHVYDSLLHGAARGYSPLYPSETRVAVWFWDEDEMRATFDTLSDASLPKCMLYVFLASVLSDLDLCEVSADLRMEWEVGVIHMQHLLADIRVALTEIVHDQDARNIGVFDEAVHLDISNNIKLDQSSLDVS